MPQLMPSALPSHHHAPAARARFALFGALLLIVPSLVHAQTKNATLVGPVTHLEISALGDSILVGSTAAVFLGSYFLQARKPAPAISGLSISNVPAFDRLLYTTSYSSTLGYVSDGTVAAVTLLPLMLVPGADRNDIIAGAVVYSESVGISYVAKDLLKSLVVRYRPYAYSSSPPASLVSTTGVENSFPSGHVTVAFAAAVTGGMLFDRFHTKPLDRALYWGTAMSLATGTAALRVASGNHFLSDVVAGAALGSLVGFLVPYLHTVNPSSTASSGGASSLSFFPPAGGSPADGVPIVRWSYQW